MGYLISYYTKKDRPDMVLSNKPLNEAIVVGVYSFTLSTNESVTFCLFLCKARASETVRDKAILKLRTVYPPYKISQINYFVCNAITLSTISWAGMSFSGS